MVNECHLTRIFRVVGKRETMDEFPVDSCLLAGEDDNDEEEEEEEVEESDERD